MFAIDPANDPDDKTIFYKRVRANIIGLRIIKSLNKTSLASLKLKESKYLWISDTGEEFYDGPTMLQICVEKVNPNTRVGVADLKETLRNVKLANFSHNVRDMTDQMTSVYDDIIQRGFTHEDFILDIFRALLSGKNDIFTQYVQRQRDSWDTGTDITPDQLIKETTTKYNNMVVSKTWAQDETKNSKIVALATQVKELQGQLNSQKNQNQNNTKNGNNSSTNRYNIPEWRLTKSFGDSVEKDGTCWHWCSKQHNKGKGMYVTHKESDHLAWQERRSNRGGSNSKSSKSSDSNSSASTSSTSKPTNEGTNKSMTLSDNMKAAMVSKFKCSAIDAEKLWADVVKESN
jgi:hypothetical protein